MERRADDRVIGERVASIDTAVNSKGGILDRLQHIDACVDNVKRTIWIATGFISAVSVIANLIVRRYF